jgi:hypothetical protein
VVSHDATLRQTVNDAPSSLAEVATISGVDEADLARYGLASSTSRSRINGGFVRIGVVFPQNEIGADAGAIRAYGQRVEELGFSHVLAYDHVVGADPAAHQGWNGPYDVAATFHEPMVMFGFLASLTGLELVTGVIILPQRQTVLAAKQAAEVDLLTGGRFRLDGALAQLFGEIRPDDRRWAGTVTGTAAHPSLVRRPVRAGLQARR